MISYGVHTTFRIHIASMINVICPFNVPVNHATTRSPSRCGEEGAGRGASASRSIHLLPGRTGVSGSSGIDSPFSSSFGGTSNSCSSSSFLVSGRCAVVVGAGRVVAGAWPAFSIAQMRVVSSPVAHAIRSDRYMNMIVVTTKLSGRSRVPGMASSTPLVSPASQK